MIHVDNLALFADELKQQGIQADYEIVFGNGRLLEGLDVGEDFFPLWELMAPENAAALEKLDFDAIKARRSPNWSLVPPPGKFDA
jgi:hypothetical protein